MPKTVQRYWDYDWSFHVSIFKSEIFAMPKTVQSPCLYCNEQSLGKLPVYANKIPIVIFSRYEIQGVQ